MKFYRLAAALAALCLLPACESDPEGVFSIDATGHLNGLVYVDRNANGELEVIDAPAPGVTVELLTPGSQQVIMTATSNASGIFNFADVPVGRYSLSIVPLTLGDSLQLAVSDETTISVPANDTATAVIALNYQQIPIADVVNVPAGRRVIIRGVALNALTSFGDSTLHVADVSGVLRALRVAPATILAGDTVQLLGTVTSADNTLTLADVTAFRLATAPLARIPVLLTTAAAATADTGSLAFDLVRIDSATIVSTQLLPGNEVQINVDDGSGILAVILDPAGQFGAQPNVLAGALLDATGLLVPAAAGTGWVLKPRNAQDISATIREVTIAEARTLSDQQLVQIEALAMNASSAFGNGNVHLVDATGSLRVTQVPTDAVSQADSVRFTGRIRIIEGHTVLALTSQTVLLQNRTLPAPTVVSTLEGANADGGTLDASLVHIDSATVTDVVMAGGTVVGVGINDGSGRLEVRPGPQISTTGLVVGATVRMTGLLVPISGSANWMLRPRVQNDVEIITP